MLFEIIYYRKRTVAKFGTVRSKCKVHVICQYRESRVLISVMDQRPLYFMRYITLNMTSGMNVFNSVRYRISWEDIMQMSQCHIYYMSKFFQLSTNNCKGVHTPWQHHPCAHDSFCFYNVIKWQSWTLIVYVNVLTCKYHMCTVVYAYIKMYRLQFLPASACITFHCPDALRKTFLTSLILKARFLYKERRNGSKGGMWHAGR